MQFALEVSVLKDELWRNEVGRSGGGWRSGLTISISLLSRKMAYS